MKRSAVPIFLGFLVLFSALFFTVYHSLGGYYLYLTAFMWSPGLAALCTLKITGRPLSSLGWGWGRWGYQVEAYTVPILYVTIAYLIVWGSGLGGFYDSSYVTSMAGRYGLPESSPLLTIVVHIAFTMTFGVITYVGTVLGEEIGWRGFLVPELAKRYSLVGVSLISGIMWAVWHYPLLLAGSDMSWETLISVGFFTVMVIALSFILASLRLSSGSLWTAVILHATHNVSIQRVATPLTVDIGNTSFYIDETGLVLPAVIVMFAVLVRVLGWFIQSR